MSLRIKSPLAILADSADGGIVVDGTETVALVPRGAGPEIDVEEVFDGCEHVVLPDLINTHHHFYQTLTRAHPEALDKELFPRLSALDPVWSRMTAETVRPTVRTATVELMLSGRPTTSG